MLIYYGFGREERSLQSVAAGTIYISIFMLVSKALGLVRNIITASLFGTSWRLDAVFISMKPASLAVSLFAGAMASALVPIYIDKRLHDEERAKELAWNLVFWTAVIYALISIIFFAFPLQIVKLFAPGFSSEILMYAARKLKYVAILMVIMAIQSVLGSLMRSARKFFQYGFSMIFYNIVAIPVLVMTADNFGEAAYILSTITGQFVVVLVMIILFYRHFKITKPSISMVSEVLKKSSFLMTSSAISLINPIIDNAFASMLPSGRISSLNYAFALLKQLQTFIGIFVANSFTELAEHTSKNKTDLAKERMRKTAESSLKVILPLTLWLVAMPNFFIGLLLERGNFTAQSTGLVSAAIIGYSFLAIVAPISASINQYLIATNRLKIILYVSTLSVFFNAFFDWILMKPLAHAGIALSSSLVALIATSVTYTYVRKSLGEFMPWGVFTKRVVIGTILTLFVWKLHGFDKIAIGSALFAVFFLWSARDEIGTVIKKSLGRIKRR